MKSTSLKHYYNKIWEGGEEPSYISALTEPLDNMHINNKTMILDIGCGNGLIGEGLIKKYKCKMVGIDISSSALNMAKQKGYDVRFCDLDHGGLPFEDNYFDIIIASAIIEHIYDPKILLEEAYRVLGQRGKIIILTPNINWLICRILFLIGHWDHFLMGCNWGHVRYLNKKQLVKLLKETGFKSLDFSYSVMLAPHEYLKLGSIKIKNPFLKFSLRCFYWQSLFAENFVIIAEK